MQFSFKYYLCAIGTTNVAVGIHTVIYPWIIVGILEGSPSQLGFAQMILLIPNLLFILPAGVISDRLHQGSWLALLYLLYLFPLGFMLFAEVSNKLNIELVIGFGLVFGTITAFAQPARESLLGHSKTKAMHQLVAKTLVVRFIALGFGFLCAGALGNLSLSSLVCLQMSFFAVTAILIRLSQPTQIESTSQARKSRNLYLELVEGMTLFRDDKRLLHLLYIVFATGILPFGAFIVATPILAHQIYHGGAGLLASIQMVFILGVVAANIGVMRKVDTFSNPGRSMIVTFFWRGVLLLVVAWHPSFWLLFPAVFFWGLSSGLAMALGRTIIHDNVALAFRARAVSMYQLSLFGGTPLGAWLCGIAIENFDFRLSLSSIAILTAVLAILAARRSPLWVLTPSTLVNGSLKSS